MSYNDDQLLALSRAIRDFLDSGIVEELRLNNLLKAAELGVVSNDPIEIRRHPIYKAADAKRRKLSK